MEADPTLATVRLADGPRSQSAMGMRAVGACIAPIALIMAQRLACRTDALMRCGAGAGREDGAAESALVFVAMTARTCAAKAGASSSRRSGARWLRPPV